MAGLPAGLAPVAAVTHGGVTTDLLRNLLPDQALPAGLADAGIPPCAITALDSLTVISIAATGHLPKPAATPAPPPRPAGCGADQPDPRA